MYSSVESVKVYICYIVMKLLRTTTAKVRDGSVLRNLRTSYRYLRRKISKDLSPSEIVTSGIAIILHEVSKATPNAELTSTHAERDVSNTSHFALVMRPRMSDLFKLYGRP